MSVLYFEMMQRNAFPMNLAAHDACVLLEHLGYQFCVDYGYMNAEEKLADLLVDPDDDSDDDIDMPAEKFTKKATTPKLRRQWSHVEESALARGEDPSTAIRMASGVVKRESRKKRSKR